MGTDTVMDMLSKPDKTGHPIDFALDGMRESGEIEMYQAFMNALRQPDSYTATYVARIFCQAGYEMKGPQVSGWRRREGHMTERTAK